MTEIELTVQKASVYDEVAKTTSYTGAKMTGDDDAYERIFTTDDDRMMLERFWVEACSAVTEQFKPFLLRVSDQPESHGVDLERNYNVVLELRREPSRQHRDESVQFLRCADSQQVVPVYKQAGGGSLRPGGCRYDGRRDA